MLANSWKWTESWFGPSDMSMASVYNSWKSTYLVQCWLTAGSELSRGLDTAESNLR